MKNQIDWQGRVSNANRYFKAWYEKFQIGKALDYYQGFQWDNAKNGFNQEYTPYTVNLIFTTIGIKKASYLFDRPKFTIKPHPNGASEFDPISSGIKASLKTEALNDWISNRKNYFSKEVKMAIVDAFFGFGIIETGYSANIIENPNAEKPAFHATEQDKKTNDPEELLDGERAFIKRIYFKQFRVGGKDNYILERSNWCGYYDYYDVRDIKHEWAKKYSAHTWTGSRTSEFEAADVGTILKDDSEDPQLKEFLASGDVVKVWKFWDFREKKIYWWDETHNLSLDEEDFDECGLSVLIFNENRTGFLPIPMTWNWLSPQDEVNEASEQLRAHRRRGARKYLIDETRIDEEEAQKVINGPDGTYGKTQGPPEGVIYPVPLSPLDSSVQQAFVESKDNFNIVAGTSSDERGQADRTTATQAAITDKRSQIQDSEPKLVVAQWMCDIAFGIIKNLARITNAFYIKSQQNPAEPFGGTIQPNTPQFKSVSGEDLEGDDFEADIEISSISPIENSADFQKFLQFISILNQYQEIGMSPMLVRYTASKLGITDENVIAEYQKMAQLKMVQAHLQMQAQLNQVGPNSPPNNSPNGTAPGSSTAAQNMVQNATPPAQEQVRNQILPQQVLK